MLTKSYLETLRNFLNQPSVRAGLKAVVFGLLILNVQRAEYSSFSILIFLVWAFIIYVTPVQRKFTGLIGWVTLCGLALLMPSRFTLITPQWAPYHVLPEHLFAIIFTVLCYLYICVAAKIFKSNFRLYQVLHAGLVWGTSLLFITGQSGLHPIRATIIGAFFLYGLTHEYFTTHGQKDLRLIRFAAGITAIQFVEIAWVLRLLPISIGYTAAALALLTVISTAITEQYLFGTLRSRFLRYSFFILVISVVLLGSLTRWIL